MARQKGAFAKSEARTMTEVECAYLGALIDGEGNVSLRYGSSANYGKLRYVQVSIGNTELELISATLRITGCGGVHYRKRPGELPFFTWHVTRQLSILSILQQISPYSLKAQEMLVILDNG